MYGTNVTNEKYENTKTKFIFSVSVQCALSNEKETKKNKVKKREISQQKINFDKII